MSSLFSWWPIMIFFLVGILSYALTPLVIWIAWRLGMVDDPHIHKHQKVVHTYPVPRGGGLGIYIAITLASCILLPLDKHLLGILGGGFIAVIVGLLDDRYDLSPSVRLGTNILSALAVVASGIGIAYLNNPLGGIIDLSIWQWSFHFFGTHSIWILSDLFALVWIVGMMNLLGQGAGGIEGQFPGVVTIAGIMIAILSSTYSADITQWPVMVLAIILAGAYAGFLPWNFFPQKIMPGYSGKSLAGYLLAVLAILSTTKVGTLLVVLGLPLVDTGWTYLRRIYNKKSPLNGDRGHLHHRLLDAGWSKQQIVFLYWGITLLLGGVALFFTAKMQLYVFVGLGLVVGGVLVRYGGGK